MRIFKGDPVAVPADWVPGPKPGEWTYEDYVAIPPEDDHRYDIVEGMTYLVPSSDSDPVHRRAVEGFFSHLHRFVESAKLGKVYQRPFDVVLNYRTVVQPDVFVLLNEHLDRITDSHIIGAPDLVIEITAPNTATYDVWQKWDAYIHAGVPEYWLVTPEELTIELLILEENDYRSLGLFIDSAKLPSQILPHLPVSVAQLCTGIEAIKNS